MTLRTALTERKYGTIILPELPAYIVPVASIVLDAPGLDFLIEQLPADDGMTLDLVALRERAREALWARQ